MTENEKQSFLDITVNTTVKRRSGVGSRGVVQEIREELNTGASEHPKEKRYLIKVKWDSGTVSYFAPESLVSV